MEKANNLKISILGKPYLVTTDEAQENVLEASELVDNMMREKIKRSPVANETKIAVVTALELAAELCKLKKAMFARPESHVEIMAVSDEKKEVKAGIIEQKFINKLPVLFQNNSVTIYGYNGNAYE